MKGFIVLLIIWNFIVFLLFGIDKLKAKKGSRRISERALLLCSLFLGSVGGLAGMYVFRHKTLHKRFRIGLPLMLLLHLLLAVGGIYLTFLN